MSFIKPMTLDKKISYLTSISVMIISTITLILFIAGHHVPAGSSFFFDNNPVTSISFILLSISILTVRYSERTASLALAAILFILQITGNCSCIRGLLNLQLPAACTVTSALIMVYTTAIILFTFRCYHAAQLCCYIAGTVGYAAFLSGITGVIETSPRLQTSPASAIILLLLAVGFLSTRTSEGLVEPLYSERIGGYTGRMLIPVMMAAITLTALIIITAEEYLPFSTEIFLAAVNLALAIIIITFTAYRLNLVDTERIRNQKRMERTWKFFRNVIDHMEEAVTVLDGTGKPIYENTAMKELGITYGGFWDEMKKSKLPQPVETFRAKGRYFTGWMIPLEDGGIISLMDVTGIVRIQDDLRANIAEKEALLRELHHRVKNNLQIILSLINIQLHDADEGAREALIAIQTRVQAMAMIQESIYSTGDHTLVSMQTCTSRIIDHLKSVFDAWSIDFHLDSDVKVNLETAMPLALIINELVSNALKHASPGRIEVEIREQDSGYHLRVADDGAGLKDFKAGTALKLVRALVGQLEGELRILTMEDSRGTEFMVPFRELEYRRRT